MRSRVAPLTSLVVASVALCSSSGISFAEEAKDAFPQQNVGQPTQGKRRKRVKKKKVVSQNPGKMESLQTPITNCLELQNFQGARFGFNYPLFQEAAQPQMGSEDKQVILGTNVNMGSADQDGGSVDFTVMSLFYGGQYLFMSQSQLGQQGQGGRLNGRCIAKPKGNPASASLQFVVAPDPNYNNIVLETDYKGHDWTVGGSLMPGIATTYFLQRLSQNWSAGVQGFSQFSQGSWLNYVLNYSTLKRKTDGEQFLLQVNGRGPLSVGYAHKVDETLTVCSELQVTPGSLETQARAGAQYTKRTFMYKAHIDSTGTVASSLNLASAQGFQYAFSAELKHSTNEANFGVGISLG